jgi:hypothetical protein
MSNKQKHAAIVRLLDQRTRDGTLQWEATAKDGVFQTSFPRQTLRMGFDPYQDSHYLVQILDDRGRVVDEIREERGTVLGHPLHSETFARLYSAARQQAMRVDETLDEVLERLQNG